jgi:glycosyltransferase involved in cell wall biosynthesis
VKIGIFDPYLDSLSGGEKYMLSSAQCLLERHEVFIFWDQKDERAIKDQALYKLGIDIRKAVFVPNIFSKNVSLISRIYSSRQYDSIIYLSDGSIPFVLTKLYIHFQFPTEWVKRSLINSLKLKKVSSVFCNSFFTKEYIDKEFGIKSRVLYPPIFIPVFHKVKKENIILNVGRFSINPDGTSYKKQDILVDVFKSMVDNGLKKWRFVLVIGSEEKDREKLLTLEKQAKGYPI